MGLFLLLIIIKFGIVMFHSMVTLNPFTTLAAVMNGGVGGVCRGEMHGSRVKQCGVYMKG